MSAPQDPSSYRGRNSVESVLYTRWMPSRQVDRSQFRPGGPAVRHGGGNVTRRSGAREHRAGETTSNCSAHLKTPPAPLPHEGGGTSPAPLPYCQGLAPDSPRSHKYLHMELFLPVICRPHPAISPHSTRPRRGIAGKRSGLPDRDIITAGEASTVSLNAGPPGLSPPPRQPGDRAFLS